jgi:hypothetical protein
MTDAIKVHADNAFRFADNFAVVSEDGIMFHGCEHNQEEADAIATWITSTTGRKTVVIKNGPDRVRDARAIRGDREIPRYQLREEALVDMGVWKKAKKGRQR